jgi:hypothetical protein
VNPGFEPDCRGTPVAEEPLIEAYERADTAVTTTLVFVGWFVLGSLVTR